MYADPGIITFYFWVHVILLGIFGGTLLYQMVPDYDEEDNRPTPNDEDDGWPGR